jgi:hypothetical protein
LIQQVGEKNNVDVFPFFENENHQKLKDVVGFSPNQSREKLFILGGILVADSLNDFLNHFSQGDSRSKQRTIAATIIIEMRERHVFEILVQFLPRMYVSVNDKLDQPFKNGLKGYAEMATSRHD